MARVVKFLDLDADQRWLLCKVTMLLAAIRLSLWVLPYPAVRRFLDRLSQRSAPLEPGRLSAERLAWATTIAGRIIPGGGHCLTQALTLRTFMSRRGYPARICYGVRGVEGAPLMAHAWVEHDGTVLIGGGNLDRFRQLLTASELAAGSPDHHGGRPDVGSA